jgi:ABC-type branched-subunit amino acid transport system ATPase component
MVEGEAQALKRAAAAGETAKALAPEAEKGLASRLSKAVRERRSRVEIAPSRRALNATREDRGPLRVEHLRKSFGGLRVLEDVSFHVDPGEILGLVGPNGAGKSTICNLIAGLIPPDEGRITFGSREIGSMAPHRRVQFGLGRTYQTPRVFPSLTLAENVAIAGSAAGTAEARRLLEGFGVVQPDKLGETATLMERRMVEIARLSALQPHWVLLDEPLAGLATEEHDLLLERVKEMAEGGTSVMIIEHLVPVIAPITDRIVVLDGGRLIADGPPEVVLRQQEVVDAYLGEPIALELAAS